MVLAIFAILIGLPIAEIYVFAEVGGRIGGMATIGLTLLTTVLGAVLLRVQGLAVLRRVQDSLSREEMPIAELVDGLGLLIAGALLMAPGFITDAIGLLLFLPPLRVVLIGLLLKRLAAGGRHRVWMTGRAGRPGERRRNIVIDGEYRDLGESEPPPTLDTDDAPKRPPHRPT